MAISPTAICKFNATLIKILTIFFTEIRKKKTPKIHMEAQNTLNSQSNPEKKEQCLEVSQT
jgi:hypothetical protein